MAYRLPDVLTAQDYSIAEMSALVLHGEAYWVGSCVSPVDVIPSPRQRATALKSVLPPNLIVERMSAGWVWGVVFTPPLRHQVCADTNSRTRPPNSSLIDMREVVIGSSDTVDINDLRVTTPFRTTLDIARVPSDNEEPILETMARLMLLGGFDAKQCLAVLDSRRNLPHKKVAAQRIRQAGTMAAVLLRNSVGEDAHRH